MDEFLPDGPANVSRFILLIIFVLWKLWSPEYALSPSNGSLATIGFLGFYFLLVVAMGIWARFLAMEVDGFNLHSSLRRFTRMMNVARQIVPAWFGVGLFFLGWGDLATSIVSPIAKWNLELPAMLVGTLPALAAWAGLWWSQFPADRALREQSLLVQIDQDLPVHAPPGFWKYIFANLRMQMLFVTIPILLISLLRDVAFFLLHAFGFRTPGGGWLEACVLMSAAVFILLFIPEVVRRVLKTRPLPDSALRRRLEKLCSRYNVRCRDILLWHTDYNMGNAFVIGLFPRVRYVLLSDLLLETMTDDQVEAVFAHEMGHIIHQHLGWYVVLWLTLVLFVPGPGQLVYNGLSSLHLPGFLNAELLLQALTIAGAVVGFIFFTRCFERQADVFAARTMEAVKGSGSVGSGFRIQGSAMGSTSGSMSDSAFIPGEPLVLTIPSLNPQPRPLTPSPVGRHGAALFASALHRVAVINNMPVAARAWLHGSIETRMNYLTDLSHDPDRTTRFDRVMKRLYATIVGVLTVSALWVAMDTILHWR